MNVNCNVNSDIRAMKLHPALPDYMVKERLNENFETANEANVIKAIKSESDDLSITVNANEILAMYNRSNVSGIGLGRESEPSQMVIVSEDEIVHDFGYDELVAEWQLNGENLCDKDKIKLLSLIIDRTGNDETAKNMWCAIRFEFTNNVYMTNINNIDNNDSLGYMSLMNILQMLDVKKGDDCIAARECIKDENTVEQKLIGYKALLSEQEAIIAACNKLLNSPHLRRKDYPILLSRLSGATEKADLYSAKINELNGIRIKLENITVQQSIQPLVK